MRRAVQLPPKNDVKFHKRPAKIVERKHMYECDFRTITTEIVIKRKGLVCLKDREGREKCVRRVIDGAFSPPKEYSARAERS